MSKDYNIVNNDLKRIKTLQGKDIGFIAKNLNYNHNCIITGGKNVEFSNGAKVPNRKLILEAIIKELILNTRRSVVFFYKSPFIKYRIMDWLNKNNIQRTCSFVGKLDNGEGKCLAPFGNMSNEEIIYTVRCMSSFINVPFDHCSETFLEYILNIIQHYKCKVDFENIMMLISLSNEELAKIANKLGLETEGKYFSKANNGSESIKRVMKDLCNYFKEYYQADNVLKMNICSEVLSNNIVFIEMSDQYHKENLEYFYNELKCCIHKCPYIVFDDIMLKNNPNFEDFLLSSTGVRFIMSAVEISAMLSQENFENFMSQAPTKILLHYDNANTAEKVTSSVGSYYHMKVSHEESRNREAFHFLDDSITVGRNVTEEKRLIIEGTDLTELNENRLYLVDTAFDRFYFDNVKFY